MKKFKAVVPMVVPIVATSMMIVAPHSQAQSGIDSIANAIKSGTHNLSFRLRHESVEQDNPLSDADATTLRSRLALKSGSVNGFTALLEVDNVSTIGSDEYDSFILDEYRGNHSIIADPVYTEINQVSLTYKIDDSQNLIAGRQRLNHAAQRFIGGVGWRQNEQTYDAASYTYKSDEFSVDYSYVWNVNRIFASSKPSAQRSDLDSDSHFLIGSYKPEWGTVSGYVYALDFEDVSALSSITYGVSYAGKLGPVTLNAALASQSDYGDATVAYDAEFYSIDAAIAAGPVTLKAGYEVLGSDDGVKAFATPLSTLHKWQGWADLFLNTPANGIEDMFFTVSGNVSGVALAATYHDFQADTGGADYGSEFDLIANYKINDVVSTQLKYASFDSDGFAVDTDKLWVSLMVAF